ncbi:hypothetical protein BH10CYA1_BH10CYA1_63500 [soil metagenome]
MDFLVDLKRSCQKSKNHETMHYFEHGDQLVAKILIVDDDLDLIEDLRVLFETQHYIVSTLVNGNEAFEHLKIYPYDLITLDWELPGMSGLDVCQNFRGRGGTPVLMLTGKIDLKNRLEGLDCGADDYLVKPFHALELLGVDERMRNVIHEPAGGLNFALQLHFH